MNVKPVLLIRGNIMRRRLFPMKNTPRVPLLLRIIEAHNNLYLHIDFFFVQGFLLLLTKSGNVDFISVQNVPSRMKGEIKKGLATANKVHKTEGLIITDYHGDNEFNRVRNFYDLTLCTHVQKVRIWV